MSPLPVPANKYISMIYRYTRRYFSKELRAFNLESGQLPFLLQLYRYPGITQEGLSAELGMDKGTTARSIAQLEECGLAYRVPNENDRRANLVFPTQAALSVEAELFDIIRRLHTILFKDFTAQESAQALDLLIRMKDNISNEFDE